ncbi:hypothetical protein F0919_10910 [Taibaiella lutea]|uniref:Ig-like domain-containing protein n=1 Tax=Taibaiella lutea TaxID=2608001 RepID=A0A5M6CJ95_9BACT|nr:hypothetical protein [Taibaiella lutea]KAA5535093.1 hypothetical protein F0919_10910 [Taibaiella lutea]
MKKNQSIKMMLAVIALGIATATTANAQNSDTSKVCSGQTTLPKGPDAPNGTTYSYAWFDAQNSNAALASTQQITIAGATLSNTTNAPKQFIYKLVVSESGAGISACPSDTFYKVVLVYPALSNTLTTNYTTICTSGQQNLILTSPTTATAAGTAPVLLGNYGTLKYTWTGNGIAANTTTTGIANNTYTVNAANLPAASPTPYTYSAAVSYAETIVGVSPAIDGCTHSANANVTISTAPTVSNTNVTTTFQ